MEVGVNFNNIEIIEKIAEGGMGEVFKALQKVSELFERVVVVKNIKKKFTQDEDFIAMFFQEAKITARLIHENIVQVYDLNKIEEEYYILMEFIDGKDLLQIGKHSFVNNYPMPLPIVIKLMEQVCNGLKYAHEFSDPTGKPYNIVHRDISLQNIMVTKSGTAKILDFGVMQTTEKGNIDMMSKIPGKANYMSPELITGAHVDGRSDIFSLGILFYQLLTGRKPFKSPNIDILLEKIVTEDIVLPSKLVDGLPKDIDHIVTRMLAKNPENRYSSAYELQEEFENYLFSKNIRVSKYDISDYITALFKE